MEYFWQSDVFGGLNNHPFGSIDSTGTVNVHVGWENERWRFVAYVENAADETTVQVRYFSPVFQIGANGTRPRTAGLNFSYRFGM